MKRLRASGFTISELLIVISILGIFVAMVMPNFMGVRQTTVELKDRRNAQMIAQKISILNAASESHAKLSVEEKISLICGEGVVLNSGTYEGVLIRVSGIAEEDITGAMQHLRAENGELIYDAH